MELKLDKTAGEAMEQINLKNYPERFSLCGLPVVKVAINFDSERCTIGEWKLQTIDACLLFERIFFVAL